MNTDQRLDRLERLVTEAETLVRNVVRSPTPRALRVATNLLRGLKARLDGIVRGAA